MSRERYRDIWKTYCEIWGGKMGASALPCGEETVDSTKGDTGHGAWLDGAIDFFGCAVTKNKKGIITSNDVETLHGLYYCSIADTRKPYTKHEKRIGRIFWLKVKERGLDKYGMFIAERM